MIRDEKIRNEKTTCFAGPLAKAALTAALAIAASVSAARADVELPASASTVRNAIVAMSLADAALPCAAAVAAARDERLAAVPSMSSPLPALKPETSAAMASMRTAAARSSNAGFDRRVRAARDPFLLMLGVGY